MWGRSKIHGAVPHQGAAKYRYESYTCSYLNHVTLVWPFMGFGMVPFPVVFQFSASQENDLCSARARIAFPQ